MSDAEAARLLNVSERSVERAKAVRRDGAPELVKAVEAGTASLSSAAEIAKLPVDEQQAIVEAGPVAVKEVAKSVRKDGADPEKAALRKSVIEASKDGNKPTRKDRRNKDYEDDPAYRMLMRVIGPCSTMIEQVARCWADYCPCDSSDPDYGYADIPICRNLKKGVPVDDGVMAGGAASRDARRALREHEDQYGAF